MPRGLVSLLSVVLLVVLSSSLSSAQTTCGYGGVSVTTTSDLILNNYNGWNWAVRPCGQVSTAGFCNAQFCQAGTNISYYSPTGDYSGLNTDNAPLWAYTTYAGQQGIAQIIQDGADCGGFGARQGTIEFICNPTATTPYLAAVNEPNGATCHYQAIVYTSAVCSITTAATQQIGASIISTQCGGGVYNLNSLAQRDLTATQQGNGWVNYHYIRVCGVVNSTNLCVANSTSPASVCQIDPSGWGTGNTLAMYEPLLYPTVYQFNGNGMSQIIQDGARCGTAEQERLTNITLVCNAAASTPVVSAFFESPTCHYTYIIQTSVVCGTPFAAVALQPVATCGFGPYDLSPLMNQDLLLSQTGNQWAIRPCGVVQTPGYCAAQFCQGTNNVSFFNPTGDYSSTNTDNAPAWAYTSYLGMPGVAQIIQDGTDCGNYGARQGTIEFICNLTATTPFIATVIETVTCHYQAVIMTNLVCGAATAQLQAVGSAVMSTQCGGGIYDLSPLSSVEFNYTQQGNGWVNYIFIRMCGTVTSTSLCASNATTQQGSSAQICQIDPSGWGTGNTLGTYEPYQFPTIYTYNGNGMSQIIQDGKRCGSDVEEERLTNITFICNAAASTPMVSAFFESPVCHYNFIVQTSVVCGTPFPAALTLPGSSQNCTYGPYNLNSISGQDLIWYGNGNWWAIRPCGVVQTTGFCAGQFCQGANVVSYWNGSSLANYASTGTDNTPIWASISYNGRSGVAQIIQDGASCGGNVGSRQGAIYFLCNPAATTPYISNVTESIVCHYTAIVQTSAVCGVRDSALQVPGTSFVSNQCGGTVYNLSALATTDIVGSAGSKYTYYINICGTVRGTSFCLANNSVNASVCQVDPTIGAGYGFPLSQWNPFAYPVVWQYNGVGAVSQIIQDGFACGNEERLTNITLVCSPSATTPVLVSVVESPTCHYTLTVQTNQVCGTPFSVAQPAGSCQWGGFDLSPLTGSDLFLNQAGTMWAIRPCGTVQNSSYCGGQFCQGTNVVSYYNPTGDYSSTGSDNVPVWAYTSFLGQPGIAQIIQDGTDCGGYGARQGTIEYICNSTATTPYLANVIETITCHYQAVIMTNLVCGITTSQLQALGTSVISTQCGGGMYDLSSLTASDITTVIGSTNYSIRLCGVVSSTQLCQQNASAAAQICQVDPSGWGTGYAMSVYQPYAYPTVYQYNGNGLSQYVQDGERCGNAEEERTSNITLICVPTATTPQIVSFSEAPTCHYNFVINTNAVCGTPFSVVTTPVVQSCQFGSFDLSTITSQDLLWQGNNYWWAIRPCGTVQTTGFCAGQFCQGLNTISLWNGTALANYASTGTDNVPQWAYVTYSGQTGVAQIIQDGTSCGGNTGSRQGAIYFLCNPAATTPYITSVAEADNVPCHYTAIVQTSAACGVSSSQMQAIGSNVVSTQCGGGIYDLTTLATTDIVGSAGSPYNYYINICGVVRNTNLCLANNSVNASVCQVDPTIGVGYGFPLSVYNPSVLPVVYQYNGNGLSQIIQDGFACGNEERLTNITLVCSTTASTPVLVSVVESPTCHYTFTVQTNQVCGAAFTGIPYTGGSSTGGVTVTGSSTISSRSSSSSSSGGAGSTSGAGTTSNSSSSSSLSGGAIAGIVIGSVVGVAILLAVCAVLFAGRRNRKTTEPKEAGAAGGNGRYGEMDQSQVEHSQTGYEQNETGREGAEVEMQ